MKKESNWKTKILSICLAVVSIITILPLDVFASESNELVISGSCGENATYTYDETTKILNISGYGTVWDRAFSYFDCDDATRQKIAENTETIIINSGITEIGSDAFVCCNCSSIKLPDGLKIIHDGGFDQCCYVTSIKIPETVTYIGGSAFAGCQALQSISLPDGLEVIEELTFSGCRELEHINIPSTVKKIGNWAFTGCCSKNLELDIACDVDLEWHNTLEVGILGSMGYKNSFCGIINVVPGSPQENYFRSHYADEINSGKIVLKTMLSHDFTSYKEKEDGTIVEICTKCGYRADGETRVSDFFVVDENGVLISYAGDAGDVVIPEGIATEIGAWTFYFYGREDLTSITIPEGVTSIGKGAFYGCSNLTNVSLPSTVTEIDDGAFMYCKSLKSINIPEGVTNISLETFKGCTSLTEITIPSSVEEIEDYAFSVCNNLISVTIKEGVKKIGSYVFMYSNKITKISVPRSVSFIDDDTFSDCWASHLKFIGEQDSYAQQYARAHDIPFIVDKSDKNMPVKLISDCQISAIAPQTFTDDEVYPTVTVIYEGTLLIEDKDYILGYWDNRYVGDGAYVCIVGIGEFSGIVTKTFTINKAFQLIKYTKSYTKAYGATPFWVNADNATLGIGGELSYSSSNKGVATVNSDGKVTIKGTGAATITITAAETDNYKKTSVKITLTVSPKKQTVTNLKTAKGRKLTVKWKKDARTTGYQIQYSTKKSFSGAKTVNIGKNTTTSKSLTKLTTGKRYYVRIRSYKTAKVNGKTTKLYGAWSSAKRSGGIKK